MRHCLFAFFLWSIHQYTPTFTVESIVSEDASQYHRCWRAWEDAPSSRHALYRSLWEMLLPLPEPEQQKVLEALREWAGADPIYRLTHRTLSREEVPALAQGGLISVGAHTVTHPLVSALPAASQRDGIQGSKAELEEILDGPVTCFSYPYGSPRDCTAGTLSLVREAKYARACSNFGGAVGRYTDQFQLPRVFVKDWVGKSLPAGWRNGFVTEWPLRILQVSIDEDEIVATQWDMAVARATYSRDYHQVAWEPSRRRWMVASNHGSSH